MFLSDFSKDYLHLKLSTRVWRIHFQNIFGAIQARSANSNPNDELIPKKYFAAHYLSIKILDNLTVGLFEQVVFGREGRLCARRSACEQLDHPMAQRPNVGREHLRRRALFRSDVFGQCGGRSLQDIKGPVCHLGQLGRTVDRNTAFKHGHVMPGGHMTDHVAQPGVGHTFVHYHHFITCLISFP